VSSTLENTDSDQHEDSEDGRYVVDLVADSDIPFREVQSDMDAKQDGGSRDDRQEAGDPQARLERCHDETNPYGCRVGARIADTVRFAPHKRLGPGGDLQQARHPDDHTHTATVEGA
jgi:hypothetical protein